MRLLAVLLLSIIATASFAEDTRELRRAIVVHCTSDGPVNPPVVYLPEGVEPPPVVGELPPGVSCLVTDTSTSADYWEGRLLTYTDESNAIEQAIFDAVVVSGGRTYRISDWVDMLGHEANGALYRAESAIREDSFGARLRYPIRLLRRTPDLCEASSGEVVECRDRTTVIVVELAPGVVATLDYRP